MAAKASTTRTRSEDKGLDPYYERLEADEFEVKDDEGRQLMEIRCFDDRDELGVLHVQFRAGRRGNATFHGTPDELREILGDVVGWLDDIE